MEDENEEVEEYQNKIDDAVDCGGCVETWEALTKVRAKDDSKRRSFLKGLSAIVGISSFGGIAAGSRDRGRSSKNGDNGEENSLPDFKIIKQRKSKRKFISIISKDKECQRLVEDLGQEDPSSQLNTENIDLVKSWDKNDKPYYIVSVSLVDSEAVETEVTAKIQNGEVKVVYGHTIEYDNDQTPIRIKQHTLSSTTRVSTNSSSDNLDGEVQTESADVEGLLSGKDLETQSSSSRTVSTQSSADCEACKTLAGIILSMGCGVSWGVLCGVVTAPTAVGPMACPAAAAAICAIMQETDYMGSDLSAESICAEEDGPSSLDGLGFCNRS